MTTLDASAEVTGTCWIGVASLDHVQEAVAGGFAQLHHGKRAALDRLRPGDRIVYYSPRERMGEGKPVQMFTAIGEVRGETRLAERGACLHPFRRDVQYFAARSAPIAPLLSQLSFTRGKPSWGLVFRRGAFRIDAADYRLIAASMAAAVPEPSKLML